MKNGKWGWDFLLGSGGKLFQPSKSARTGSGKSWIDKVMPLRGSSTVSKNLGKVPNKVVKGLGSEPKGGSN